MSLPIYVLGVDPGPTTGIVGLSYNLGQLQRSSIIQCDHGTARELVGHLLNSAVHGGAKPVSRLVLAIERFVVGHRAVRSSSAEAGRVTRELVEVLVSIGRLQGAEVKVRAAVEVKPWATDARLTAVGLHTPGSTHARDAGRHALFAAVADCGIPDPLSTRARSPR